MFGRRFLFRPLVWAVSSGRQDSWRDHGDDVIPSGWEAQCEIPMSERVNRIERWITTQLHNGGDTAS